MLVPHDPQEDPRIRWVSELCADIARTDVIGAVWSDRRPAVEYDGRVAIERVNVYELSSSTARATAALIAAAPMASSTRRYLQRTDHPPGNLPALARLDHRVGAARRFFTAKSYTSLIVSALERRGRSVSIPPRTIVCHDIYALLAAPPLKARFGCSIIYDSHEFWPQADLVSDTWEERRMTEIERRAIRHADVVITVSPPLGEHLERLYGLDHVVVVPNAEPFDPAIAPSPERPAADPVRFLLQGQVAPGRGIETLLTTWSALNRPDAILELRAPENAYLTELRERFAAPFRSGLFVIRPPVREDELVGAATSADVGIIPYVGPNVNHVFACPNKLSQYMHAGLAILANDLVFVGETIRRYDCGVVYRAEEPETLGRAIRELVEDRGRLAVRKRNAYDAAEREFNWEVQSRPYREVLEHAVGVADAS